MANGRARSETTGRFMKQEQYDFSKALGEQGKEAAANYKEQGALLGMLTGQYKNLTNAAKLYKAGMDGTVDLTKEQVEELEKATKKSEELGGAISELAPGLVGMAKGAQTFATAMQTAIPGIGFLIAGAILLYKTITGVAKKIAETRKDLGVSAMEAVKLEASFKLMSLRSQLIGVTTDDLKESFAAARDILGATRKEALALSESLAATAMRTGQTEAQLTRTLSVMESISDSSREALLAQIETTGQLMEQAGLAPGDIFKDVSDNMEHFAKFAKDGGGNVFKAAAAAKRLGLNMSAVASSTESLLDFESSIDKQLEASMLLGRQINLDKARQLALTGKHTEMMDEILKQVGGEEEFNRLNVIQRQALADSVGQSVENLSRLVKTQKESNVMSQAADNASASQNELEALNKIAVSTAGTKTATENNGGFFSRFLQEGG